MNLYELQQYLRYKSFGFLDETIRELVLISLFVSFRNSVTALNGKYFRQHHNYECVDFQQDVNDCLKIFLYYSFLQLLVKEVKSPSLVYSIGLAKIILDFTVKKGV